MTSLFISTRYTAATNRYKTPPPLSAIPSAVLSSEGSAKEEALWRRRTCRAVAFLAKAEASTLRPDFIGTTEDGSDFRAPPGSLFCKCLTMPDYP
jgi:hypothetical protein